MATDVRQQVMGTIATNQARGADYKTAGRTLNTQLVSSAFDVAEQAGKVASSAISADREKKLQELQYAYEQEVAKGTFDYIDCNKENGEEYVYDNVIANSDSWIDNWIEQNGGYLSKIGALKSSVKNYKESLKSGLIENTRNRAYNAIQTYNNEKVSALTSIYTDYTNYDINKDVATTFADEGYTTIEQLTSINEYGIGEAAQRYLEAYNNEEGVNNEEAQRALIDLRLAFAAKNTGESEGSFEQRKEEIIDSVYRGADLAQFTKAWINSSSGGVSARYQEVGSDTDILDSAYKDFIHEVMTTGITLSDGTVISPDDLSSDDLSKLRSDFTEYGSLVLSSAVEEQEKAWNTSDEAYNKELANGRLFMSINEEVEFRKTASGGVLSEAYIKKQIPQTRVAEYSTRESITKLANAYTTLTKEWSAAELEGGENSVAYQAKVEAVQTIKNLGMMTFAKTSLGLGSNLMDSNEANSDDTPLSRNEYMQSMLNWMKDNDSDLAHAIVANDGLSTSGSTSRSSKSSSSETTSLESSTSATGDNGGSWAVDVNTETSDEKIDKFWEDVTSFLSQGYSNDEVKEKMKELGYNVDDPTRANYSLWSSYEVYSKLPVLDSTDDYSKELYRSITKVKFGKGDDSDEDRINNNTPTLLYSLQSDVYQVGYLLSHTADYTADCSNAYTATILSNKVNYYIQSNDYDGFVDFLKEIGSTYKLGSYDFSTYVPDENGKVQKDSSLLVANLLDRFKEYAVNEYTGFIADYQDAELTTSAGTLGKFDDVLKEDVKETMTAYGQTFLQMYKYQNPTWDITKGYDGIKPLESTLYTMGEYSNRYKDFCAKLMVCKSEPERQSVLSNAQRYLTNDAYSKLEKCGSVDLVLKSSGFNCFDNVGFIEIAQRYLGGSDLSKLLGNSEYNELQTYIVSNTDLMTKVESKLLECQNNPSLDAYSEIYTIIGQGVQDFVTKHGVRAVGLEETRLSYATGVDTRNDLKAIQDAKDDGKLDKAKEATNTALSNYKNNLGTYRTSAGYGDTAIILKLGSILNPSSDSYLNEDMAGMLSLAYSLNELPSGKVDGDAEWVLQLGIALNAWDPSYSFDITLDDLSSENIATTKAVIGDWWSQLDSTMQVYVRDTAAAFANVYSSYLEYDALGLGDSIKYDNGRFVSSKFGEITRGENGSFYYTNDKGDIIDLKMYSDKTPTSTIAKDVLPDSLSGEVVLRVNFTEDTISSIQQHNATKSDIEGRDTKEAGGQYVLVAMPNCITKNSVGFAYSGSLFGEYEIKEYTLNDVAKLYKYYSDVETNDPMMKASMESDNFDFETLKEELLSQLSPSQVEYVKHEYTKGTIELTSGAAEEGSDVSSRSWQYSWDEWYNSFDDGPSQDKFEADLRSRAERGELTGEIISEIESKIADGTIKLSGWKRPQQRADQILKTVLNDYSIDQSAYEKEQAEKIAKESNTIPMEEKLYRHNNTAAIERHEVEDTIDKELELLSNGGKDGLSVRNLTPLISKYKDNQSYLVKMLKKKFADGSLKLSVAAESFAIGEYGSIDGFIDYLAGDVDKRTTEK